MSEPRTLSNGPDPDLAWAAIRAIEAIDAEILSEKNAYAARVKVIKDRRSSTIEEYRDRGVSAADLKGALKVRAKQAQIDEIRAAREEAGEAEQFDLFMDALKRGEAEHKARAARGENLTSETED